MPEELRLYYYEKDTEKKAYDLPIANYNDYTSPCSDFSYDTVPIYNDKFENVGTLARVLTLPYIKDINFGQYRKCVTIYIPRHYSHQYCYAQIGKFVL